MYHSIDYWPVTLNGSSGLVRDGEDDPNCSLLGKKTTHICVPEEASSLIATVLSGAAQHFHFVGHHFRFL